jgi:hypothetical protein
MWQSIRFSLPLLTPAASSRWFLYLFPRYRLSRALNYALVGFSIGRLSIRTFPVSSLFQYHNFILLLLPLVHSESSFLFNIRTYSTSINVTFCQRRQYPPCSFVVLNTIVFILLEVSAMPTPEFGISTPNDRNVRHLCDPVVTVRYNTSGCLRLVNIKT